MADVSINERATIKRLIVAGKDDIWYEGLGVAAGTMTELDTSGGAIDTSDQLVIFEAFQKVFVVNGANLKVVDFINIKIYDDTGFTNSPAKGDIVYQNGASAAQILVDYIDTTNKFLYGYVISGTVQVTTAITTVAGGGGNVIFPSPTGINGMLAHATLATAHAATDTLTQADTDVAWITATDYAVGDVVLDTEEYICIVAHTSDVGGGDGTGGDPNGGGNPTEWTATVTATMIVEYTDEAKTHTWGRITAGIFDTDNLVSGDAAGTAFTPTATDISPPVWYDWTVYPGGASGTMPTKAYLGCLYRGRNVLSGNPNYPHQWYMSKVGNPWDWEYASTDPLTAAAGNAADAGETGDIIRALIPYKDDYLIFGCASTIWVLTGDPAGGGKIDEVDLTVGMYGANSWCFDGDGNLYFWGTGGIYKIPLGFRSIENLTEISLPDLISDEDTNPSTHRITMGYDRKRHGILICITKLSDGSNSNYWYDLKLKGFFPESYPNECGPYSLFYYAANDNDYADLLVGCKDGYIRKFVENVKSDDIGGDTQAISSYAVWPIQHLTKDNDKEGKLTSLTIELSGGLATTKLTHAALTTAHAKGDTLTQAVTGATMIVAFSNVAKTLTFGHSTTGVFTATANDITGTGDGTTFQATAVGTGSFTDTDGVSYEIHVGDDAETVIEKIKDGVAPHGSGTMSNSGRKARIRSRVRGAYLGIKFLNSEASESWAINKVFGIVKEVGRIK